MRSVCPAREAAGLLLAALLPAAPHALVAQHTTQVSLFGGAATDQLGRRSNAIGVSPSITFAPGTNVSAQVAGNATRYAADAWSLGGGAALLGREPLGRRLALTVRGDASASRLHGGGSATFLHGEISPALELNVARATLFGGGRLAGGATSQDVRVPSAGLLTPETRRTARSSRRGAGALYGAVVTLIDEGGTSAALSGREDRLRVGDERFVDRTASLAVTRGAASLAASLGRRSGPDERDTFGSATLVLPLAPQAALEVSGGRYASNPLLGTPGGEFLSVGISLRFAGDRGARLPRPSDVPPPARGLTRLSIRAPDARTVEIAGDFNRWNAVSAHRAPNGVWYADLRIRPGRYRYAFRVNGVEWRVPDGATVVDDGFGGKSAWLSVDESRAP